MTFFLFVNNLIVHKEGIKIRLQFIAHRKDLRETACQSDEIYCVHFTLKVFDV